MSRLWTPPVPSRCARYPLPDACCCFNGSTVCACPMWCGAINLTFHVAQSSGLACRHANLRTTAVHPMRIVSHLVTPCGPLPPGSSTELTASGCAHCWGWGRRSRRARLRGQMHRRRPAVAPAAAAMAAAAAATAEQEQHQQTQEKRTPGVLWAALQMSSALCIPAGGPTHATTPAALWGTAHA